MTRAPRYYVRVGADTRGPVDEATVAAWVAQGMRTAEIGEEGAPRFLPIEQSPLAHLLASPTRRPMHRGAAGGAAVVVLALLGSFLRVCNRHTTREIAAITAALPAVGSEGELTSAKPIELCPGNGGFWGWPCGHGTTIASGSRARIMKTGVFQVQALCRYWVKDGPSAGAGGDAPCEYFHASAGP